MAASKQPGARRNIVAKYPYHDEKGVLLFEVVRFAPKSFAQRRPDGHGGYVWGLGEVRRVPYRLPALLGKTSMVYVTEGEKDADRLSGLGLPTTCNPCGAGKWRAEFNIHFTGRDVIVLPDNDGPGLTHAEDVALALHPFAKSVRIAWLYGIPEKGDVSDWLDAGHTITELEEIVAQTPVWCPPEPGLSTKAGVTSSMSTVMSSTSAAMRCFADITPEQIKWLWPERIPLGKLTLLIGDPGLGKSLLTVDLASRVTRDATFPDGTTCTPGSVIFMSAEDDPADTIRPRLDAAGADVSRVHILEAVRIELTDGTTSEKEFDLETGITALEDAHHQHPEVNLIIIDPISAYLGGTESHSNAEVRRLLTPLAAFAARHSVALLLVTHLRKSGGAAVYRAIASIAFAAAARAVWAVAPDPDNQDRRLFLPVKQNLAGNTGGLAFQVRAVDGVPRLAWELEPVWLDANEVLGGFDDRETRSARRDAEEWLLEQLTAGPVKVAKIEINAKAAGIKAHTLRDAATALRVKRGKLGFQAGWEWSLPHGGVREEAGPCTNVDGIFEEVIKKNQDNGTLYREDAGIPSSGTFAHNGMFEGMRKVRVNSDAPQDEDAAVLNNDTFEHTGTFGHSQGFATDNGAVLACARCGNREQNVAAAQYHYNKLCPLLGTERGA